MEFNVGVHSSWKNACNSNSRPVVRHFTSLQANEGPSDSQLLNSNNLTEFTGKADVVVAGAGIIGLCYAIHLKNISPNLKIEVFEKSSAPVQKIGESTLSSFTRFTNGNILNDDYLFRLFGLKDGLQFYCIDEEGRSVTSEDVGGLDLSFQLDRRVSELFLTMWAQYMGINVYHGVDVDFEVKKRKVCGVRVCQCQRIIC
jgi:flavin-dependent dehydrogenase